MNKRLIYIDDITSYDYVNASGDVTKVDYSQLHKNSDYLTYIVFTDDDNNVHGDIFYNGHKLTYINNVSYSDIVTDGKSHYSLNVTNNGLLKFCKSYIYAKLNSSDDIIDNEVIINGNITDNDYSISNIDIKLNYYNDIPIIESNNDNSWNYTILYNDTTISRIPNVNINVNDSVLEIISVNNTKIYGSYIINIVHESHNIETSNQCEDKFLVKLNNLSSVDTIEFIDFPKKFTVGDMYTPQIVTYPIESSSLEKSYKIYTTNENTDDDGIYVKLDKSSGRIECIRPTMTLSNTKCPKIKCTCDGKSTFEYIRIAPIYNELSLSSRLYDTVAYPVDEMSYLCPSTTYVPENHSLLCYIHNYFNSYEYITKIHGHDYEYKGAQSPYRGEYAASFIWSIYYVNTLPRSNKSYLIHNASQFFRAIGATSITYNGVLQNHEPFIIHTYMGAYTYLYEINDTTMVFGYNMRTDLTIGLWCEQVDKDTLSGSYAPIGQYDKYSTVIKIISQTDITDYETGSLSTFDSYPNLNYRITSEDNNYDSFLTYMICKDKRMPPYTFTDMSSYTYTYVLCHMNHDAVIPPNGKNKLTIYTTDDSNLSCECIINN